MRHQLRHVSLTSGLVIAALVVPMAQTPPETPHSIRIFVDGSSITLDNGGSRNGRSKVWARAGGNVAFVIENLDSIAHDVRIPLSEFVPSPGYPSTATDGSPMVPGQKDTVTVEPGEVGALVLRVHPLPHFQFDQRDPWKSDSTLGMTYKYTVYSRPAGGKETKLDPDIEIIRP